MEVKTNETMYNYNGRCKKPKTWSGTPKKLIENFQNLWSESGKF